MTLQEATNGVTLSDRLEMPFRRDAVTWLAYGMLGFFNYLLSGLGPLERLAY